MVVIRLARTGSKKNPFYHVVVTDKRHPRDGRFIERLGYYNPVARGKDVRLELDQARISYWLEKGAQASARVNHLVNQLAKNPESALTTRATKGELRQQQAEQSHEAHKKAMKAAKQEAGEGEGTASQASEHPKEAN